MGQGKPIGSNTTLIVEGEALVRFDVTAFFEKCDWRVFEAEDADQAMAVLDQLTVIRVVRIDATVSSRVDGLELAHYVRECFPPALFVHRVRSGFGVTGSSAAADDISAEAARPARVLRQIVQSHVTL